MSGMVCTTFFNVQEQTLSLAFFSPVHQLRHCYCSAWLEASSELAVANASTKMLLIADFLKFFMLGSSMLLLVLAGQVRSLHGCGKFLARSPRLFHWRCR